MVERMSYPTTAKPTGPSIDPVRSSRRVPFVTPRRCRRPVGRPGAATYDRHTCYPLSLVRQPGSCHPRQGRLEQGPLGEVAVRRRRSGSARLRLSDWDQMGDGLCTPARYRIASTVDRDPNIYGIRAINSCRARSNACSIRACRLPRAGRRGRSDAALPGHAQWVESIRVR
jgi:hypothetical protein